MSDKLETFKAATAALVDEIVAATRPPTPDALAAVIAGGVKLRLLVDVAPTFGVTLYAAADDTSEFVVIAALGVTPAAPEPPQAGPVH